MSNSYLGKTGALCKREFDRGDRRRWRSPLFREFDLAERPIVRLLATGGTLKFFFLLASKNFPRKGATDFPLQWESLSAWREGAFGARIWVLPFNACAAALWIERSAQRRCCATEIFAVERFG